MRAEAIPMPVTKVRIAKASAARGAISRIEPDMPSTTAVAARPPAVIATHRLTSEPRGPASVRVSSDGAALVLADSLIADSRWYGPWQVLSGRTGPGR